MHGLTVSTLHVFYSFHHFLTKFLHKNVILNYSYYIFVTKREKWVFSDFQIFHKFFSFTPIMQSHLVFVLKIWLICNFEYIYYHSDQCYHSKFPLKIPNLAILYPPPSKKYAKSIKKIVFAS